MKTAYFSFGQTHTHRINNVTLDKDILVKITAKDPRARMFELFGPKWAFEYNEITPDMERHFPRGVVEIE